MHYLMLAKPKPSSTGLPISGGLIVLAVLIVFILLFSFIIRTKGKMPNGNPTVGLIMPVIFFVIITIVAGIGANFPKVRSLIHSVTGGKYGLP